MSTDKFQQDLGSALTSDKLTKLQASIAVSKWAEMYFHYFHLKIDLADFADQIKNAAKPGTAMFLVPKEITLAKVIDVFEENVDDKFHLAKGIVEPYDSKISNLRKYKGDAIYYEKKDIPLPLLELMLLDLLQMRMEGSFYEIPHSSGFKFSTSSLGNKSIRVRALNKSETYDRYQIELV